MTEHTPNAQFHAFSLLQGHNGGYVAYLFARFCDGKAHAGTKSKRLDY